LEKHEARISKLELSLSADLVTQGDLKQQISAQLSQFQNQTVNVEFSKFDRELQQLAAQLKEFNQ